MVALGETTVVTETVVDSIAEVTVVTTVDGTAVVTVVTEVAVTTTVSVAMDAGGGCTGKPATASAGYSTPVSIIRADPKSTAKTPTPKIAVATAGRGRHLFVTSGECKSLGTSPLLVWRDSGTRFEMVAA
jgi:hypothetical protein